MPLKLKHDICVINNCKQLRFTDNTGFYSTTNITGWGAPNSSLISVDTATLTITSPNNVVYVINLIASTILPSDTLNTSYDIPLTLIGNPTIILDGKWSFKYTVVVASGNEPGTYVTTVLKYFLCNSKCCVTNMLSNIITCDCCDESLDYKNYNLAKYQLDSLEKAAACGDSVNFIAIKKIVDKLCLNSGCITCK